MSGVLDDVKHGVRALRRAPGFCVLALATLALGIGVTSAMFSVVYGVLLRPLPFGEPDRLVRVWRTTADGGRGNFAPAPFLDVQREARTLSGVAAYFSTPVGLAASGEPARVSGADVTANFFDVLGAEPALGRTFTAAADTPGAALVVLSDGAWRANLGADPDIVGRTVQVDGHAHVVAGVMRAGFGFPDDTRVWRLAARDVPAPPLRIQGELLTHRDISYLDVVARLADGVSNRESLAELRVLAATLATRYPVSDRGAGFDLTTVQDAVVGGARPSLLVLFAAVGGVLLIACTNLASLLLARAISRRREFAVRTALGAPRARVVRQLLIENLVLALAGGALSLVVGSWTLDGLLALLPDSVPRTAEIRLDGVVVAFSFATATIVGLGFGTAPAWLTSRFASAEALRDGGRAASTGRPWGRRALVSGQVALAVMLLAGAGVMVKSLLALQRVDVGFQTAGVMTQQIVLPQTQYDSAAQTRFYQAVTDRLRQDPRIATASVVFPTPLVNNQASASVRPDPPLPGDPADREYRVRLGSIGAQYFATLGIPLRAGRDFIPTDFDDRARSIIVNQALAARLLGGGNPLERRIRFGADDDDAYRVVGVVADVVAVQLDQAAEPVAYLPFTRLTLPFMRILARGRGPDGAVREAITTAVRAEAPDLALDPAQPLSEIVRAAAAEPRFRARLSGAFAVAALGLAALGLYGLVSYSVASRTREIATRLALGATPSAVQAAVLKEGLSLTGAGVLLGLVATLALGRLVDGLLYRTTTGDPSVLGALVVLMAAVSAVACYVPARRAMRIEPTAALRAE